jgi:predicted transport protein
MLSNVNTLIAPSFTVYQVQSINFKDLPIEIWEIKRFANDTISLAQIQPAGSVETVKTISSKSKTIQGVSKEIKVYTEEDHLKTSNEEVKELYQQLKEALLGFSHKVRVKPTKKYIGFIAKTNFVDVRPQKKALKIWFNLKKGELDDPKDLVRDMSSTGHWGNGEYEVHISDDSNLEYILSLAKQALKRNS